MLMMLKEIYSTMDISPDSQVVQQILPFEVPDSVEPQYVPLAAGSSSASVGMDPTAPISDNVNIGPPPISGFVRK
ncbi:S23-interacting protein [Homalodisca vitripennis]|nr:S23-interacting protein [Homalodisca vitripennis]